MHVGWVPEGTDGYRGQMAVLVRPNGVLGAAYLVAIAAFRHGTDGYRGQMAVLVRPNGVLGAAYLAAIAPFRHLVVYPLMMRDIGRAWRQSVAGARR